jgi:hypothetical protein
MKIEWSDADVNQFDDMLQATQDTRRLLDTAVSIVLRWYATYKAPDQDQEWVFQLADELEKP